jgi:hypothetical protein
VKEKKKKYRRELYTWYIYIFFCYLAETPQEQQQSLIGVERLANAIHFALRFLYPFFFLSCVWLLAAQDPLRHHHHHQRRTAMLGKSWLCRV